MEPPPLPQRATFPPRWLGPVFNEADVWPNTDWWNNFKDAELSAFIDAVKANNLDLANNRRNLESAQLTLVEGRLARWPTPQVSISDGAGFVSDSRQRLDGFSGTTPEDTQLRRRRLRRDPHETRDLRAGPDGLRFASSR